MTLLEWATQIKNKLIDGLSEINISLNNKGQSSAGTLYDVPAKINAIQSGITPTGTIDISTNGTHNVSTYEFAKVLVPTDSGGIIPTGTLDIITNGEYDVTNYARVDVEVPTESSSGGVDTYDATATSADIADDMTAYVKGEKITGSLPVAKSGTGLNASGSSVLFSKQGNYLQCKITNTIDRILRANSYFTATTSLANLGDALASDVRKGKTFTSSAGLKVEGTAELSGGTGGLTSVSGETTALPISTGLSSIRYLMLHRVGNTTGLVSAIYDASDGSMRVVYCTSSSSYSKAFTSAKLTASDVSTDGGVFDWTPSTTTMGLSGTYTWIAVGSA